MQIRNVGESLLEKLPTVDELRRKNGQPQIITKVLFGNTFHIEVHGGQLSGDDILTVANVFKEVFKLNYKTNYDKGMSIVRQTSEALGNKFALDFKPNEDWTTLHYVLRKYT